MAHTLAELQELVREYNARAGAFAEAEGQDTVASLVEAVAREATI